MRRALLLIAGLLVACTNDYGAFRYPKKRPADGSGGTAGAAEDSGMADAAGGASGAPPTDAGTSG